MPGQASSSVRTPSTPLTREWLTVPPEDEQAAAESEGITQMLDPRIDKPADVLIPFTKLKPGDKGAVESFDAPPKWWPDGQRIGDVGAIPLVETRHVRVLRSLYRTARKRKAADWKLELARMSRWMAYNQPPVPKLHRTGGRAGGRFALRRALVGPVHTGERCSNTGGCASLACPIHGQQAG